MTLLIYDILIATLLLIIVGMALVGFGIFPQLLMGMVGSGTEQLVPLLERIADAPAFLGGVR